VNARGRFIVLEGVEGVGKTTQWKELGARLRAIGQTVVEVREPGGPNVGEFIRELVLSAKRTIPPSTEALLFAASRSEVVTTVIRPALERGDIVLVDRFLLSTYAYQGGGRGIDHAALHAINAFATGGLTPDVTLLLTLPLDAALERAALRSIPDRIEREDRSFHQAVASTFLEATTAGWQQAHPDCGPIVAIDATGSAGEVTNRCVAYLAQLWPSQLGALLETRAPSAAGASA
jgi:dTMP kinase